MGKKIKGRPTYEQIRLEGSNQKRGRATPKTWHYSNADHLRIQSSNKEEQEKIDRCNLLCDLKGWKAEWLFDLPKEKFDYLYAKHVEGKKLPKPKPEVKSTVKGISMKDIDIHKQKFPTFKDKRLIKWLNQKPHRWHTYESVAKANKSMMNSNKKRKWKTKKR